jgi:pyruvate dehydrogenase complex dihydrolipoamide acetyltransferase long form
MAVNVTMPKLGLTMETGKIVEWKKQEGEEVKAPEVLLTVETEKITYEVESPGTGFIHIIVPDEAEVPVAELIGIIGETKEEYDKVAAETPVAAAASETAAPAAQEAAAPAGGAAGAPSEAAKVVPLRKEGERIRISPLARKMAAEMSLDVRLIPGSGPGERIVKRDILAYKETAKAAPAAAAAQAPAAEDRLVKFTGMRRAIARKMVESKVQAAQAYMANNCDATAIQELRAELLPYAEKKAGVRVTITDIMMKITAHAIRQHPVINTRYTAEGDLWLASIDMGMAMALKDGLIVPVIRNIDNKSIIEIAKERVDLIDKGRSGKLLPDDITGSTFTLSAMGMFGLEEFYAIINQPENAILAVGAIIDKPVVVNKQIVIRPMMNVSLTYDHRTVDGAEAGQFMRTLKTYIENPTMILAG